MKRLSRPIAAVTAGAVVSTGLLLALAPAADAAVLGSVSVSPSSGTDTTLFSGTVNANCPSGTTDSYWSIDGPDLPADQANLGPGSNSSGTGAQSFTGASIANIKSTNAGSFSANGTYFVKFNCFGASSVTDTYQQQMNFVLDSDPATAGNQNAYTMVVPARATATTLSAAPASPQEQGTSVTFTADVTPTSGSDNPTGTVQFFDGATSLGAGSALSATGVSTLTTAALGVGTHSITAQYTPSGSFTGSTSSPLSYTVNAVAARSTTAVFAASPTSGNAYQSVTLTCDVTPSSGTAVGSVSFLDGTTSVGSASTGTANGAATRYQVSTTSLGAGTHDLSCAFTGTAPYQSSTSNHVAADYAAVGATPDAGTVDVVIPQGVLTITTPYHVGSPLHLGTATLDPSDSTYSAQATFGDATAGYITITDTRSGNLGWHASLQSSQFSNGTSNFPGLHAGLTGLTDVPVAGNALNTTALVLTNHAPFTDGLGSLKEFASYPAGQPIGTAKLFGTFGIDQVPTSITPGTYTATVTFTAV